MVKANTQSNKSKYLYIGVIVVRIQIFILICEFSLTFLGYVYQFPLKHQVTKVVVFNSNGKCFLDTFMCANHTLETVNSYCYLGVTFKHTGSLTHTSTLLMEKAKKALFKIKNTIGLDNPCNLLEKLFDNLVIPVMLYCSEIWGSQDLSLPGFDLIHRTSRKRNKKARRNSGGISVYVKHSLKKGVKKLETKHTDITWIKLDHLHLKLKKDIYLASVYISPEHTSGNVPDMDSVYSQLLQDIEIYSKDGDIVIQGDFNAYTSTEPDYILSDDSPFANDSDSHYVSDVNSTVKYMNLLTIMETHNAVA